MKLQAIRVTTVIFLVQKTMDRMPRRLAVPKQDKPQDLIFEFLQVKRGAVGIIHADIHFEHIFLTSGEAGEENK